MTLPDPVEVFRAGIVEGAYPGGQFAAARDGQLLAHAAAGDRGAGPVELTTPYDLASLTKPLATALLAARALEAGELALEDPLQRWFPAAAEGVTIRGCLDHSAGFPAHRRFDLELPADVLARADAAQAIIERAASTPLERAPGAAAVYSDIGYIALGGVLEQIFGSFALAFAALGTPLRFLDRRGGETHDTAPFAGTEPGVPLGFVHDENARAMGGVAGHAGLFGSALDVLRAAESWLDAARGRGGLLRAETVQLFWAPSAVPGSTRTLGFDRPSAGGASTGGRWPLHSVGHLGFTGTSIWIEPERALVVVLVTNRVRFGRDNLKIRALRPRIYDAAFGAYA